MATQADYDEAIAKLDAAVPATEGIAMPDVASLCAMYKKAKPTIDMALPIIEKIIPGGAVIGRVVRILEMLADQVCK